MLRRKNVQLSQIPQVWFRGHALITYLVYCTKTMIGQLKVVLKKILFQFQQRLFPDT